VREALLQPDRDPSRPWLHLLPDEMRPTVMSDSVSSVVWSSLWTKRPDAIIRFDITAADGETELRWTLSVTEPIPDDALVRHMRKRLNVLINSELRHTFGQ
jgi:hypothetical protein